MNHTYYRRHHSSRKRSNFSPFFYLVIFLVLAALVLKACVGAVSHFKEEKRDEAILNEVQGDSYLRLWGQEELEDAGSSQSVLVGDTVGTRDGAYATLTFYNGTRIYLDENTELLLSSFESKDEDDFLRLELLEGRVFVDHLAKETGLFELTLQNDVVDLVSDFGSYLAYQVEDETTIYPMEESLTVRFFDRSGPEPTLVEEQSLQSGFEIHLDRKKRNQFLARESVSLVQASTADSSDFFADAFVQWATEGVDLPESEESGEEVPDPESEEGAEDAEDAEEALPDEADEADEPDTDEAAVLDDLRISISSPSSPFKLEGKSAIAIEGQILSGTASKVTITWSGDNQPYALGYFEAGGTSFRYVADVNYQNLQEGQNSYTITAYDAEGNVSNSVTVVVEYLP